LSTEGRGDSSAIAAGASEMLFLMRCEICSGNFLKRRDAHCSLCQDGRAAAVGHSLIDHRVL
jgi:hypothetical protein